MHEHPLLKNKPSVICLNKFWDNDIMDSKLYRNFEYDISDDIQQKLRCGCVCRILCCSYKQDYLVTLGLIRKKHVVM